MHDRFDQEFYRPRWQRVLPVGPDGIQPYVQTGRGVGSSAAPTAVRRLLMIVAKFIPSAIALGRCGASGAATLEGRR